MFTYTHTGTKDGQKKRIETRQAPALNDVHSKVKLSCAFLKCCWIHLFLFLGIKSWPALQQRRERAFVANSFYLSCSNGKMEDFLLLPHCFCNVFFSSSFCRFAEGFKFLSSLVKALHSLLVAWCLQSARQLLAWQHWDATGFLCVSDSSALKWQLNHSSVGRCLE